MSANEVAESDEDEHLQKFVTVSESIGRKLVFGINLGHNFV
jgi:hypothetical protein